MRSAAGIGVCGWLFAIGILGAGQATAFQMVSITRVPAVSCPPGASCPDAAGASASPASISALPGGRFEARNQTIENLARVAFGFEQVDLAVGVVAESKFSSPRADRFDVIAVADREWTPAPAGQKVPSELREMLRRLLQDRFKLQARVELTKVEVFGLQLARLDRERGPGLPRSSRNCVGRTAESAEGDVRQQCRFRLDASHIEAGGVTMGELAAMINSGDGTRMDRFVVDQTGLSGRYDVVLSIDAAGEDRRAALREAMKTQLGLTLVKTKVALPTLIIEHAEAPL